MNRYRILSLVLTTCITGLASLPGMAQSLPGAVLYPWGSGAEIDVAGPPNCEVFEESGGLITMETESAPVAGEWSLHNEVDGALGQGYYEWKHGDSNMRIDGKGQGILRYAFKINTPGTYRLILRSAAPHTTEHNDVWARFTDNDVVARKSDTEERNLGQNNWFKVYQNKGKDQWNWAANTVDHNAHRIYALIDAPGTYHIELSGRSTLFKVDRIVLFESSVNTGSATDLANPESSCTNAEPPVLREPDTPPNTVAGIQYAYYEGDWSEMPDFSMLDPVATGITSAFGLSLKQRDDQFAFLFDGFIDAPEDGTYTFYTESDDGSQLFIGDRLVVDNDGTHAVAEEQGTIALKKGLHALRVVYFEQAGGESLSVSWAIPGNAKTLIDAQHLVYDADNLLPVELVAFDGFVSEGAVTLTWQTASEINNAGFEVERAIDDAATFTPYAFIEGAGTSAAATDYRFIDASVPPTARTARYRLKQIDFDGSSTFSETLVLPLNEQNGVTLHPNYPDPFNPTTTIAFTLPVEQHVQLEVYDASGRLIQSLLDRSIPAGTHDVVFDAPAAAGSGLYVYKLQTPTSVQSGTMLLLK